MTGLFGYILLIGATYGFALYIRDWVRAFRRFKATGEWKFWPPDPTVPPRPDNRDGDDRWWER
jgi:hypothetical protein